MTAFPVDPPARLDDAESIQAHDWQAYRRLPQMENHWSRPGWTDGRRSYHWMLLYPDGENVRQLAKQCQAQLEQPAFDLVPLDTLHVTIGRLGFTDEMTIGEAVSAADEARPGCERQPPFSLTVGPLAGSKGAVRFSLAPWSELVALHRGLTKATQAVRGANCPMDASQFRPHLSIAYSSTTVPLASIRAQIEQLRTLPTETADVTSVQLVELRREGRAYRFEVLQSLQLGN